MGQFERINRVCLHLPVNKLSMLLPIVFIYIFKFTELPLYHFCCLILDIFNKSIVKWLSRVSQHCIFQFLFKFLQFTWHSLFFVGISFLTFFWLIVRALLLGFLLSTLLIGFSCGQYGFSVVIVQKWVRFIRNSITFVLIG